MNEKWNEFIDWLDEEWRDIEGYEGLYQVSNLGRVKSLGNDKSRKEKIRKLAKDKDGYLLVLLCKNGEKKNMFVHRLVALSFIENPQNLETVNHKDENKENNRVENLEFMSIRDNLNYGTHNSRMAKTKSKPVIQYTLDGEFVREWPSTAECGRNGFDQGKVSTCCRCERKSHKGFIWKYKFQ